MEQNSSQGDSPLSWLAVMIIIHIIITITCYIKHIVKKDKFDVRYHHKIKRKNLANGLLQNTNMTGSDEKLTFQHFLRAFA